MADARVGTALVACAALLAGCATLSPPPFATPAPVEATAATDAGDGFTHAERIALRVWARTCDAYRNGSAWMLDETHAVTNRHVVADATVIELTDYQGNGYTGAAAEYAEDDDLALITIEGSFPEHGTVADEEPAPGDELTATGFALGGPLESVSGPFVESRENALDPDGAPIYFVRLLAQEGNSGSPVTDADGDVVGVLFSSDLEEFAGAVSLPRLQAFLTDEESRIPVDASC
ncbi:S1 family peptidase [Demequina mangrovi]|uniref:Trypsin-like peptidase domain-containing protein n=1 Tax=Demequina mangrovi TaxID=1043493 RepID=A0A1H6ZBP7_9MICO|nr:serine protease [Demequina mangrovi]SEJ46315.1 Trypsin-like peptidase domain-containing protein [Demequina mangrovi]